MLLVNHLTQLCDTLLVSVHEEPVLRSRLDYSQASSLPLHMLSNLQHKSDPKVVPSSRKKRGPTLEQTAASSLFTSRRSHTAEASSHSHHALEVSVGSQRVTSFKTTPLDPQTTSVKGTITPKDSGHGVSPSQQAAESIRKLYDLTFSETPRVHDVKITVEKEADGEEEGERETAGAAANEDTVVESSPFLSLRRSFKISPKRNEQKKRRSAIIERSPELPQHGSDSLARRKTVSGVRVEKPKFYLRDILPVLQERNKLKERVHLLECEVESLKR